MIRWVTMLILMAVFTFRTGLLRAEEPKPESEPKTPSERNDAAGPSSPPHRRRLTKPQSELLEILARLAILKALPRKAAAEASSQVSLLELREEKLRTKYKLQDWEPEPRDLDARVKVDGGQMAAELHAKALALRSEADRYAGGRYRVHRGASPPGAQGGPEQRAERRELSVEANRLDAESAAIVKTVRKLTSGALASDGKGKGKHRESTGLN